MWSADCLGTGRYTEELCTHTSEYVLLQALALVGEFNSWDPQPEHWTARNDFGVWQLFLPDKADGTPAIPHRSGAVSCAHLHALQTHVPDMRHMANTAVAQSASCLSSCRCKLFLPEKAGCTPAIPHRLDACCICPRPCSPTCATCTSHKRSHAHAWRTQQWRDVRYDKYAN